MDRTLAKIAYCLACSGPLCLIWAAVQLPAYPHRTPHSTEAVMIALGMLSPVGIVIGGVLVATARWRPLAHAQAAVAVGIGATLACLIAFPLVLPRGGHHSVSCFSNLRQLGLAMTMYAQDYDGRLPIASSWNESTLPYSRNPEIYRCPNEEIGEVPSYGMNRALSMFPTSTLDAPADTALLLDSRVGVNVQLTPADAPFTDRHGDTIYVAFADGHARSTRPSADATLIWTPRRPGKPPVRGPASTRSVR